jgi:hypothetical protein
MENQKYKLRCRNNGIVVTSNQEKYDVVWKRKFNPEICPMDKIIYNKNCQCTESDPFINEDNDNIPYCRWCGNDFKII